MWLWKDERSIIFLRTPSKGSPFKKMLPITHLYFWKFSTEGSLLVFFTRDLLVCHSRFQISWQIGKRFQFDLLKAVKIWRLPKTRAPQQLWLWKRTLKSEKLLCEFFIFLINSAVFVFSLTTRWRAACKSLCASDADGCISTCSLLVVVRMSPSVLNFILTR